MTPGIPTLNFHHPKSLGNTLGRRQHRRGQRQHLGRWSICMQRRGSDAGGGGTIARAVLESRSWLGGWLMFDVRLILVMMMMMMMPAFSIGTKLISSQRNNPRFPQLLFQDAPQQRQARIQDGITILGHMRVWMASPPTSCRKEETHRQKNGTTGTPPTKVSTLVLISGLL